MTTETALKRHWRTSASSAVDPLVAIIDGLVNRDFQRWGGGRESSFVYRWVKRSLPRWPST